MVLATVAVMLAGHFSELFDRWDQTLRTGKDADYAVVMVAACAGVVFAVAKRLLLLFRRARNIEFLPSQLPALLSPNIDAEISATGPSPPFIFVLRI
jgi:nitrate reductase gamma subunit